MNILLDQIQDHIARNVREALAEDIGSGDITAELIPSDKCDTANIITREDCVVCGLAWADETFKQIGDVSIEWHVKDGDHVAANTKLATLKGNTRQLLTGERTALNFLQLLSGTATKAHHYKQLLGSSDIQILDTRKTLPGLRMAQKYAVNIGGCYNHRIGLYDQFLIKENHIAACGGISPAIEQARKLHPKIPVEIEVETLEQFDEALGAEADIIMLDNFSEEMLQAIKERRCEGSDIEVSGNVTAEQINYYKLFPVQRISTGDLTKNLSAIDLSMRIIQ